MHGGPDGLLSECTRTVLGAGRADHDISEWLGDRTGLILAGSAIHFDRRWIDRHLPRLGERLHYRMLDVRSVLMTLATAGHSLDTGSVSTHRAMPDVEHALGQYKRALALIAKAPREGER